MKLLSNIAVVFPGQSSQHVGMGQKLFEFSGETRDLFERANSALGFNISKLMFEGPADELTKTQNAQPAILLHSVACFNLLAAQTGFNCKLFAGHSLGEFSALVAAGALGFEDAVKILRYRGEVMQEAVPVGQGAMIAIIGSNIDLIQKVCAEISAIDDAHYVEIANMNGPMQTVISGAKQGVALAGEKLKKLGAKKVVGLTVSAPFHSKLMKPAQEKFKIFLQDIKVCDASVPVISNVYACAKSSAAEIKEMIISQVTCPVRLTEMVQYMSDQGIDAFVESGSKNLTPIIKRIAASASLYNVEDEESAKKIAAQLF